jgi:2,4-dienoyl-CoA reductase-like NADH-dependent reductase (Old Yellow Enzyme family)
VPTAPGNTPLDSNTIVTFGAYVDALSQIGLLYIHDIEGITQWSREAGDGIDFVQLRQRFNGVYIANNQYTLALAEAALAAGDADLFSIGRPFIANPDLIERLREGAPLVEAPKSIGTVAMPTAIQTGQRCVDNRTGDRLQNLGRGDAYRRPAIRLTSRQRSMRMASVSASNSEMMSAPVKSS